MQSFVEKLTSNHSQFNHEDQRFNHEALALFLAHALTLKGKPSFVVAGSEDLRALLATISLSEEGEEVYILIRPYIHCMALYARYHDNQLYFVLFDSQNWGLRYYPTRLVLDAIAQYFPDAIVLQTNDTLQHQNVQRGCTEYSLFFIEYCAEQSEAFIQQVLAEQLLPLINTLTEKNDPERLALYKRYSNTFVIPILPEALLAIGMQRQPEWYQQAFAKNQMYPLI